MSMLSVVFPQMEQAARDAGVTDVQGFLVLADWLVAFGMSMGVMVCVFAYIVIDVVSRRVGGTV